MDYCTNKWKFVHFPEKRLSDTWKGGFPTSGKDD
jgi:hypothetical protein